MYMYYSFGQTGWEKGALFSQDDLVYKCFLQIALLKRRQVIPRELVDCGFHQFQNQQGYFLLGMEFDDRSVLP